MQIKQSSWLLRRLLQLIGVASGYRPSETSLERIASISEKLGISIFVGGVINVAIKETIPVSTLLFSVLGAVIMFVTSIFTTEAASKMRSEKQLRAERNKRYHSQEGKPRK